MFRPQFNLCMYNSDCKRRSSKTQRNPRPEAQVYLILPQNDPLVVSVSGAARSKVSHLCLPSMKRRYCSVSCPATFSIVNAPNLEFPEGM
jgi:hypothetical protein